MSILCISGPDGCGGFLSLLLQNTVFSSLVSGEFVVVNKHLLNDLTDMGIWTLDLKNSIIHYNGSIQRIPEIPDSLKAIYRYVRGLDAIFCIDSELNWLN